MGSAFSDRRHCAGPSGFGEAKALELLHAADQGGASVSIRSGVDAGPKIDNSIVLHSLAGKRAIELGPAVRLDLGVEVATDLEVASRPEFERGKMCSAGAHALADVVAGDHKVAAVVTLAAYDDMDVGIIGIPVVDPNPIELGAEIPLGLRHQVAGERLEIGELLRVLRGHDEAEMMAIPFAALGECAVVGVVVLGIEQAAGSAVLRHALPPQVGQVSAERRSPRPLPHDAGLDGDAARPIRHQPSGREAGRSAAAEGGAPGAPPGSAVEAAGLLGCRQRLRDERLSATGAALVADAPDADAEIVVARHDAGASEVHVIAISKELCELAGCRAQSRLVQSA